MKPFAGKEIGPGDNAENDEENLLIILDQKLKLLIILHVL